MNSNIEFSNAPFVNEPLIDFSELDNIDAMQDALAQVREQLGQKYPFVIGDEIITTAEWIASRNPARHAEVVGEVACGNHGHASRAIAAAENAFGGWRTTPVIERAAFLQNVAAKLRARKFEFAAWLVFEISKTWSEAHAEVAQAIDFCEYYARQMQRIGSTPSVLRDNTDEKSELEWMPLGVGVVLAPWNYPLSILCGTTLAPTVAGNTVVMKPSPRAPVVAARFFKVLEEAGMPPGVVNFLVGRDEEIGDVLVDDPRVHFVSFTGSKEIGLRIHERAAKVAAGQNHFKRTVLEMGGKGAIIVDETADLDATADAIAVSAFGYQGQKCSACSRVVALAQIHDALLQKLVERAGKLLVRDPASPNIALGAVIDERAYAKICSYFSLAKTEALLRSGGVAKKDVGYFVWPTIYSGVKPGSRLANEEIFGPVLSVMKARDFEEALKIANESDYGLTGGVFSQNEKRLVKAREEFQVGNLYFNRAITGGFVGIHPLGGFKLSGDGSKTGGLRYVQNFLQEKLVARRASDEVAE
jgi:1-pyrroline-5-carboxylate dehydrogenase